jgi:hypothetical protein
MYSKQISVSNDQVSRYPVEHGSDQGKDGDFETGEDDERCFASVILRGRTFS